MRFYRALVSSLLFVSAVLAVDSMLAGAIYEVTSEPGRSKVVHSQASVRIPISPREVGTGFTIAVGLDTLTCETASVSAGLVIYMDDDGPWIRAWFTFVPAKSEWSPESFKIYPGDSIAIQVWLTDLETLTGASFHMHKVGSHRAEDTWTGTRANNQPLCLKNAHWTVGYVTEADGTGHPPLTNFEEVTFSDIKIKHQRQLHNARKNDVRIVDIKQNGRVMTSTEVVDLRGSTNAVVEYKRRSHQ